MNKQTIYDLKPEGKTIYIRVDYNVPHDKEGHITDDRRIVATLPTLRWLLDHGAALVIASHMGRPKGEVKPDLSLAPVAKRLSELLHMDVKFASDCIGEEVKEKKAALSPGEVLLLENIRFHKEEEKNDPAFAKALVEGCDLAVNDAFGVSHRSHASIAGVGKLMPMVSGLLLKKEIDFLDGVIEKPERPVRCHHRRREDQRQDSGHCESDGKSRCHPDRRRYGEYLRRSGRLRHGQIPAGQGSF